MKMSERPVLLVVDDEPDVVKSVQDLLRFDYRVLGATRAEEGLRLLAQEDVQVVMSDQQMPEITGVAFLRQVRDRYPDAVRLLFTGYADIRAVIDAINQGSVYRYIAKPWDSEELQTIIREAVALYALRAERKLLLRELQAKNDALEKANTDLKQANDLKLAFIEVASHELRTPITILRGMTELAAGMSDLPAPLPDWLARMHRASGRLQHLVEQLVAMLRAGQFDRTLDCRPTDLSALLKEAVEDIRPFVEIRKQTLRQDWPDDLGLIEVEAAKIRDAVNHLLLNAIKFTPDEGVITVSARRLSSGGGIEIIVRDTGDGIEVDNQALLFEPFFTGLDTAHHSSGLFEYKRKGLGLGLSVVKAFVEMHGGTIHVQSGLGSGTTFTITLPGS